jgi:uncharacterized protein
MNEASPPLPGTGPLSEVELARLDQILSTAPYVDRAMRLDELQGLCVALAMGPDPEISQKWLNLALGEETERPETPAELLLLLERYRAATEDALNDGTLTIRGRETRTGRVDYVGWCEGFLDGVNISETDWFAAADPDELSELMFPIDVLADALPPQERAAHKPNEWRNLVRKAEQSLADTVARLAHYWSIVRAPPVTIRRELPKVGRNDPCPCGSGKKFKQCHGKA